MQFTKLLVGAALVASLAACMQQPIKGNCVAGGAIAGAALGAVTDNNLAESALVGGALGAGAGATGLCQ